MKVIIIKTNNSDDHLRTASSAMRYFKEEDIKVQEDFEGIKDNGIMFAVPFLCGYKGLAIGITDRLVFSSRIKRMIFELPPLDPYIHSMEGQLVVWNCDHETAKCSFSNRNLEDVKKNKGSYIKNIVDRYSGKYCDLSLGVRSHYKAR
tara:strand:- start:7344 stop:7787 length:444 start_codon:yes stop_codon:yes gene_type:complete